MSSYTTASLRWYGIWSVPKDSLRTIIDQNATKTDAPYEFSNLLNLPKGHMHSILLNDSLVSHCSENGMKDVRSAHCIRPASSPERGGSGCKQAWGGAGGEA